MSLPDIQSTYRVKLDGLPQFRNDIWLRHDVSVYLSDWGKGVMGDNMFSMSLSRTTELA